MYDYASILFNGICNARCPDCIGKSPEFKHVEANLTRHPLKGLENFLDKVEEEGIKYISLSGIHADPQQYLFEAQLIKNIRDKLPEVKVSLHTNGRLALQKMQEFNSYDKATVSFPSFEKKIYKQMMGVDKIEIKELIGKSQIPIKLSLFLTEHNKEKVEDYVKKSKDLGINRIVIRKLVGKEDKIKVFEGRNSTKQIFNNQVYSIDGVEATVWDYKTSTIKGLYLFPNGMLKEHFRG